MEKDYSLLRPFDLEAAKRGEPICWHDSEDEGLVYISGPDCEKNICYSFEGKLFLYSHTYFRMAPLTWVEGEPVYKGDVLWYSAHGFSITVTGLNPYHPDTGLRGDVLNAPVANPCCYKGGEDTWAPFSVWSWTPPKVKREGWVNIYHSEKPYLVSFVSHAFKSEVDADHNAAEDRIACIRVEWEE